MGRLKRSTFQIHSESGATCSVLRAGNGVLHEIQLRPALDPNHQLHCQDPPPDGEQEAGYCYARKVRVTLAPLLHRALLRVPGSTSLVHTASPPRLSRIVIVTNEDFRVRKEAHIMLMKLNNPSLKDKFRGKLYNITIYYYHV